MTRCDYDTIFQRVFCVTLVAIAVTFTVILTNVFIDIDGLLSRKDKHKLINNLEVLDNEKHVRLSPNAIDPEPYKVEKSYEEESEYNYRSKRSLESQNFLFHMKNPRMKSILTSKLATLLEELDQEEETSTANKDKVYDKNLFDIGMKKSDKQSNDEKMLTRTNAIKEVPQKSSQNRRPEHNIKENDMLHLAMHNILLQGIIGHMDLNDVYRKIHQLVNNFKTPVNKDKDKSFQAITKQYTRSQLSKLTQNDEKGKHNSLENDFGVKDTPEETKFFEEMADCDKLQEDIAKKNIQSVNIQKAAPNVMIKTIIDITTKTKHQNLSNTNDNVKGIIQLIYNGKPIKFNKMDDDVTTTERITERKSEQSTKISARDYEIKKASKTEITDVLDNFQNEFLTSDNSNSYLNKLIRQYINSNHIKRKSLVEDIESNDKYKEKRYKRQIKIRYKDSDVARGAKHKPKSLTQSDDDELYVEIETHFDSKGLKGDKKKKMIRNLIQKIQKAIHSDIEHKKEEKKKGHKSTHFKKRTLHPLDKNRTLFTNNVMTPYSTIVQRQSDPIYKSIPENLPVPLITDKFGEKWKKTYTGPGFLTLSKTLNSAELSEVDVDYNKVMVSSGVPQRLQKPLNVYVSGDVENTNTYFDLGNLNFFVKNLDGTGLSLGFNQYMGEPPDSELMKVFTGEENIINTYHNTEEDYNEHMMHSSEQEREREREFSKMDGTLTNNEHVVIRRSVKELNNKDYHSNTFHITFDSNFLPYDNYEEIIEDKNKKVRLSINKNDMRENTSNVNNITFSKEKNIEVNEIPTLLSTNIFYKKLKPSEILSLADLLNRKKRAVTVKKISNLKNKIKLNKYININKKGTKKIILKKKRAKRQIDKVRIIATDALEKPRQSSENIFLVSNENLLADRAIIGEVETPEGIKEMNIGRLKSRYIYPKITPYAYEEMPIADILDNKFGNPLMSKYPHVFMEEASSRSIEDYDPVMINKIQIKPLKNVLKYRIETTTETSNAEMSLPKVDELLGAISPNPKQNYQLTVKITPKNYSDTNSGFKEIHTSINKSFNKNGVFYSSLVNVSEISKVENLHSLLDTMTTKAPNTKMEDQQMKMELLLKQHKKRIDDQLEHLNRERVNIDALDLKNKQKINDYRESSTKSLLLPNITKFDIEQLLASALRQLKSQADGTSTITTTTTTTEPIDPEKSRIITTIEKHENLTNEILHQINRNTELLETFLSKLSDRISSRAEKLRSNENKPTLEDPNKFWKTYPFVDNTMPTSELPRNGTNGAIPFVYAFHHPYAVNKPNFPVASIVYHGHIHTNELQKSVSPSIDMWKSKPIVNEEIMNSTKGRYFMDNLQNGYKIPLSKNKGEKIYSAIPLTFKNNTASAR